MRFITRNLAFDSTAPSKSTLNKTGTSESSFNLVPDKVPGNGKLHFKSVQSMLLGVGALREEFGVRIDGTENSRTDKYERFLAQKEAQYASSHEQSSSSNDGRVSRDSKILMREFRKQITVGLSPVDKRNADPFLSVAEKVLVKCDVIQKKSIRYRGVGRRGNVIININDLKHM